MIKELKSAIQVTRLLRFVIDRELPTGKVNICRADEQALQTLISTAQKLIDLDEKEIVPSRDKILSFMTAVLPNTRQTLLRTIASNIRQEMLLRLSGMEERIKRAIEGFILPFDLDDKEVVELIQATTKEILGKE